MSFVSSPLDASLRGGYVAIGNFDGVHRGHQAMIDQLLDVARRHGRPALVVTFDPHPLALLRPAGAPPGLTTVSERIERFRELGVDGTVVLRTTPELLHLTAEEFFERVVVQELAAVGLVEGPNFYFGRDRGGTITLLRQLCRDREMSLHVIEPVTWQGQWVSSSAIRALLLSGDLEDAVELLGHPFRLTGRVGTGARRGRELGFPTANLVDIPTVIPGAGVYAGYVRIGTMSYGVAVHIGPNPTFAEEATKVEAHLLEFHGDLYGQTLSLELTRRLRGIRQFAGVEELQRQLQLDVAQARELFSQQGSTCPSH